MTALPKQYAWLANEPGPKMILEALKLFGVVEGAGNKDNPIIMGWAKELGLSSAYSGDSVPWCALYLSVVAHRAGKPITDAPLWARSWAEWGEKSPQAALGDVLVFVRDGGGHVGLYVGEDADCYHVLGGNQSDQVCIKRISKERCIAVRRSYRNIPANVRPIRLSPFGVPSKNEA